MRNWRTRLTRAWMAVALALTLALAAGAAAIAATPHATPAPPTSDPFYAWSGSLTSVAPGTVLRTRQLSLTLEGLPTPVSATQVLDRTTNQLGQPDATVTTIIRPSATAPVTKIVSDQIAYDCDAAYGRPSYQLAGGGPSTGYVTEEEVPMLTYLTQGYTIVTSDYEGPTDDYGAGREAGYGTLDGIRAAENLLDAASSTPVGIVGSSGGAIATMWAAEEQATYAPALNVIGAVSGGIPVDFAHVVDYINGTHAVGNPAGALPYVLAGLFKAYHVDLSQYLTPDGIKEIQLADQGCLGGAAGTTAFTLSSIFQPQYQDYTKNPLMVKILNDSIMGREGTPKEPMLIGAGDYDGTGDGIMPAKDEQQLAYQYCQGGEAVTYEDDPGGEHVVETELTDAQAPLFFANALSGHPQDGCGSISPGTALTPLAVPATVTATAPSPHLRLQVLAVRRRARAVTVRIASSGGTLTDCVIAVNGSRRLVAHATVRQVTSRQQQIRLRISRGTLAAGRYTVTVRAAGRVVARHTFRAPAG